MKSIPNWGWRDCRLTANGEDDRLLRTIQRWSDEAIGSGKFLDLAQQSSRMTLSNLERAAELIHSFKQVAVDQSSESKRLFNLKTYLEEILLQLSPKLKATSHQVEVRGDRQLTLMSYPGAFSQIVTNLIMNSLLHAYKPDETGHITLSF
ncbi:MAG: HAMP domain-containing histidine kinase, partial [Leptolyngbyaceae cyanobacterium SL_5_9]|nr:HAMP domain-containing histidine kinase [Leptolyngbyaceae cyanobacterium SL_5_9]